LVSCRRRNLGCSDCCKYLERYKSLILFVWDSNSEEPGDHHWPFFIPEFHGRFALAAIIAHGTRPPRRRSAPWAKPASAALCAAYTNPRAANRRHSLAQQYPTVRKTAFVSRIKQISDDWSPRSETLRDISHPMSRRPLQRFPE